MQIAVFGGSFDPVHIGHETIVNKAIKSLKISKIFVVPTYLNPFKESFNFTPELRANLLKKVFKHNNKVEICDYEIKQNRAVYSIETINYLKDLYKPSKIYIIIGEDNLSSLNKWKNIDELKNLATFIVAKRKNYKNSELKNYKQLEVDIDISSSKLREKMDLNFIPKVIHKDIKN